MWVTEKKIREHSLEEQYRLDKNGYALYMHFHIIMLKIINMYYNKLRLGKNEKWTDIEIKRFILFPFNSSLPSIFKKSLEHFVKVFSSLPFPSVHIMHTHCSGVIQACLDRWAIPLIILHWLSEVLTMIFHQILI